MMDSPPALGGSVPRFTNLQRRSGRDPPTGSGHPEGTSTKWMPLSSQNLLNASICSSEDSSGSPPIRLQPGAHSSVLPLGNRPTNSVNESSDLKPTWPTTKTHSEGSVPTIQ